MNPQVSADYNQKYQSVVQNPAYVNASDEDKKTQIGDLIYPFVSQMSSETEAPKITGMIIDLDTNDLN